MWHVSKYMDNGSYCVEVQWFQKHECVYYTSSAGAVTTAQSGPVCSLPPDTHPSSKVETLCKCPVRAILNKPQHYET